MTSFRAMLGSNFRRYWARRNQVMLMLLFMAASVFLAVYISAKFEIRANVALVAGSGALMEGVSGYNVTVVDEEPPLSDLMLGRYDAVVVDKGNGGFDIRTIKSQKIADELTWAIRHPGERAGDRERRSVGANILGYLTLVILLQGLMFMGLYSDDRANGALLRIATSPAGAGKYLLAQGLSSFLLIFLTSFLAILLAWACRLDIGFGLPAFAGYLAILTANATAFALFVCTISQKPDDANAMGSSVALLTTILAGSYYDFSSTRPVFDMALNLLPQKSFLTLVEGANLSKTLPQFAYLVAFPAALFALSAFAANRKLKGGL